MLKLAGGFALFSAVVLSVPVSDKAVVQRYVPNSIVSYGVERQIEPVEAGDAIQNYQLIERTALLGVCGEDAEHRESGVVVRQNFVQVQVQHKQLAGGETDLRLEGPSLEYQCITDDIDSIFVNENYRLRKKFAGGSHGEVWRAVRIECHDGRDKEQPFILKRVFAELGENILQSGLREAHFGSLLQGQPHITRFVEHFYRNTHSYANASNVMQELWLVFYDEGISLREYMYTTTRSASSVLFQPSLFWHRMRVEDGGSHVLKEIMRQLLQAVAAVHAKGIVHRDIKPSNILINNRGSPVLVKLADFGSAVDDYAHEFLYENKGPSQAEETREYQPPEVLLHGDIPYDPVVPTSYDIWSVGVVFLELILGSPHVFSISSRSRAKLDIHLQHKSEDTKLKSYLLHVFTEFCIYEPPSLFRYHNDYALVHSDCNFGTFNKTIQNRDPLHRGFQDSWGLNLLYKLLQWDPSKRITAQEALEHAYFHGPYVCNETGRTFATKVELELHKSYLESQRQSNAFILRKVDDIPEEIHCNCKRTFSNVDACNRHLAARHHENEHSAFCHYASDKIRVEMSRHELELVPVQTTLEYGASHYHGRRPYMEDKVIVIHHDENGLVYDLYVVLDGHMGLGAVSYVKEHVGQRLAKAKGCQYDTSVLNESDENDFSGTTLTMLMHFPHEDRFICANVGDSRAIYYDANGSFQVISMDHLPNVAQERSRIESSGGFVSFVGIWRVMGQLAVSRTLGDRHLRQYVSFDPSIQHFQRAKGFILIATDGVWDTLSPTDAGNFIQERLDHHDLYEIAQSIVIEAYVRGSADNLLALIIEIP
ncbi:phosphatase 1L [Thraustotheca clavata]|uniref:Phosphatase 1L n=1 Tax=Thraustotheca clavata TaxID=74557 RepID=A0A1W0A7P0_9STRA|nr:phosphatase 1L [Thraustotheca clavata]